MFRVLYGSDSDSDEDDIMPAIQIESSQLSDAELNQCTRLSRDLYNHILNEVRPQLERQTKRHRALSADTQLLTACTFFASGGFQWLVAKAGNVSQSSTSRIIHKVVDALLLLVPHVIKLPTTEAEQVVVKQGFYDIAGFPNTLAAVDGTHVCIKKPSVNPNSYVNRKGRHSLNIQVACDHTLRIVDVVANYPGSNHDSYIWANSSVREMFASGRIRDGWFIDAEAGITEYNVPETPELPSFATSGKTFRIVTQDTVVLPCEVNNPGNFVLAWKRGIAVLTAGSVKVSPDARIRLVDGYNLEIRDVQTQDAGDYVCQIGTLEPREISHTVEILVPPRIHHVSSGGAVEVKKGATVTLECRASGNPVPTITWTRKNNILPSGEQSVEGFSITIEQANRHQGGVYQCTASNGVGQPVTQAISLHVLYPPEIEVERSWVHSGEGYEAELVCIVHADPPADMVWYRDTLRLDTTERRIMEVRGSRHTLILRKVQASDFGNYSCVADNSLGRTRQYLELSGKPNPAIFRSHPMGRYRDSYNISWAVDSRTPIEEFKLFFRRLPTTPPQAIQGIPQQQNQNGRRPARKDNDTYGYMGGMGHIRNDWNDVILPAIPNSQFTQRMSYLIRGLEPGNQYEAKVQAKNRFGWNQVSERFQFSTRGTENSLFEPSPEPAVFAEPEVRDLGMTAYSKTACSVSAVAPLLTLAAVLAVSCS